MPLDPNNRAAFIQWDIPPVPKAKPEEDHGKLAVKAKPVNLDKLLGNVKNRVDHVGIEVEGAWDKQPAGVKLQTDVSVFRNGFKGPVAPGAFGEVSSPPIIVAQIPQWVKRYHPNYIDDTCGLHIHMSFKHALHYSRLMVEEYPATMMHYLRRWAKEEAGLPPSHCIYDRLDGKLKYCRNIFWPDLQVAKTREQREHNVDREGNKKGHRYTQVNYCWGGTETVEVRVLPMMSDVNMSIAALHKVIDVTNAFLAHSRKEPSFGVRTKAEDEKPIVEKRVFHV